MGALRAQRVERGTLAESEPARQADNTDAVGEREQEGADGCVQAIEGSERTAGHHGNVIGGVFVQRESALFALHDASLSRRLGGSNGLAHALKSSR